MNASVPSPAAIVPARRSGRDAVHLALPAGRQDPMVMTVHRLPAGKIQWSRPTFACRQAKLPIGDGLTLARKL